MKLWLLEQTDNDDCDTYDSCVVVLGLLLSILIALGLYYPYIRLMMFLLWGV